MYVHIYIHMIGSVPFFSEMCFDDDDESIFQSCSTFRSFTTCNKCDLLRVFNKIIYAKHLEQGIKQDQNSSYDDDS